MRHKWGYVMSGTQEEHSICKGQWAFTIRKLMPRPQDKVKSVNCTLYDHVCMTVYLSWGASKVNA